MDVNKSIIVDEKYRSSSHSLTETDSSTMNLSITPFDLSKESEVINIVNQANNKSIKETSPNLLFEIKNLKIRNPNTIIIGNLNINSLPNKFEQWKDIVIPHIPSKPLDKHVFPYDMEGLFAELNFKKCKWLLFGTYHPPSQADIY